MRDVILVLNAGSSSFKFSLFASTSGVDTLSLAYRGEVEGLGREPHFLVYNAIGQRQIGLSLVEFFTDIDTSHDVVQKTRQAC